MLYLYTPFWILKRRLMSKPIFHRQFSNQSISYFQEMQSSPLQPFLDSRKEIRVQDDLPPTTQSSKIPPPTSLLDQHSLQMAPSYPNFPIPTTLSTLYFSQHPQIFPDALPTSHRVKFQG
mmetsp:Transcript_41853/g.98081  ORF Transcript_41853/g.98081 Transcript_41853/m.98081 type:complete len:120 (+) Transcript_41853:591-950(+)